MFSNLDMFCFHLNENILLNNKGQILYWTLQKQGLEVVICNKILGNSNMKNHLLTQTKNYLESWFMS
jgi:intracellular sulfur oxidation DsrE/DsrF family protein